jgi:hypothetical protein
MICWPFNRDPAKNSVVVFLKEIWEKQKKFSAIHSTG